MRHPRRPPRRQTLALWPVLALLLSLTVICGAQARKPTARAAANSAAGQPQPKGETVEILGRVAAGLDKTIIKDASQGYFLVQGVDLTRFAGRHIQARAVVVGREREFRIIRLLDYTIKSPDDGSPGAIARKKK